MLNDMDKTALFCEYYEKRVDVYQKCVILDAVDEGPIERGAGRKAIIKVKKPNTKKNFFKKVEFLSIPNLTEEYVSRIEKTAIEKIWAGLYEEGKLNVKRAWAGNGNQSQALTHCEAATPL